MPIIEQLFSGVTDLTASRQLVLSPRTYSRRVSELLDYLGVDSRFQAGVEAVRRGWLPVPQHIRPRTEQRPASAPPRWHGAAPPAANQAPGWNGFPVRRATEPDTR